MIKIPEKWFAWLAFAAVSLFWGTTFFAIRVGVASFPPFLMAGFRHTIGGIIICSYFLFRGYALPDKKALKTFFINGFLMLVVGNGLVTWAEIYVSSGLAALICALTPIWIVLINSVTGKREVINKLVWLGLLICLAGQFLIFQDNLRDFANPGYALGIVFIIIANLAWAIGTVYSKNHQTNTHPLFGAGLQMISGGVVLDIIGSMRGEWHVLNPEPVAVWMLAYLIIFGSLIAYGSYIYVLKKLPAAIVSTYAFINTLVAIFIGWLWLDETVNLMVMISVMLTLGGLWLINYAHNKSNTSG